VNLSKFSSLTVRLHFSSVIWTASPYGGRA